MTGRSPRQPWLPDDQPTGNPRLREHEYYRIRGNTMADLRSVLEKIELPAKKALGRAGTTPEPLGRVLTAEQLLLFLTSGPASFHHSRQFLSHSRTHRLTASRFLLGCRVGSGCSLPLLLGPTGFLSRRDLRAGRGAHVTFLGCSSCLSGFRWTTASRSRVDSFQSRDRGIQLAALLSKLVENFS